MLRRTLMMLLLAGVCVTVAMAAQTVAQTVYKSVEGGVTSFSDEPPISGDSEVLRIDVQEAANDGLLETRLTEMRETTDRMAADRREREQSRQERVTQQDRQQSHAPQPTEQNWGIGQWTSYAPGFRPRPWHPNTPWRPGLRPLPVATPPPGWSVMQPGNSQLMRPIVSSRK